MTFSSQTSSAQVSYDAVYVNGSTADGHDPDTDGFPIPRSVGWQGLDPRQDGSYIIQHTRSQKDRHQRH